jgi:hypothetical protein
LGRADFMRVPLPAAMITIESGGEAMGLLKLLSGWRWIIGACLLVLLAGCSALRIGYSQAPTLMYWWIDGHVDLNGEQTPRLRDAIERWFDWHRRSELPVYAALLGRAQREVMEPALTPQAVCAWRDEVQARLDAALEPAVPALASLLLSLTPDQLRHLERKLAGDGRTLRDEHLQADRAERARASFKRSLERFETVYGRLEEAQRSRLSELLASSKFDPERWLAERERRIAELMRMLAEARAAARALDAAAAQSLAQATVRAFAQRAQHSPRADYQAYQERLSVENCALVATMHGLMSPAQRRAARDKFRDWEDDARALAAGAAGG